MKTLPFLFPLLLLFADSAAGEPTPNGMTLHRVGAGSLNASGWTRADSTFGAFSVSLPCLFNDFSMDATKVEQNPKTSKTFAVGCQNSKFQKFTALRAEYVGGEATAKDFFEKNDKSMPFSQQTTDPAKYHGLKTRDLHIDEADRCGFGRYVHAPPDNILMIIEAPRSSCDKLEDLAKIFFDSLVIRERK